MDEKAFSLPDADYLLQRFANLPAQDNAAAENFRNNFGEIYPHLALEEYGLWAEIFRQAWHARTDRELEATGLHLSRVFERESGFPLSGDPNDPTLRPAIVVDYSRGKIAIRPRTLLDYLAKALLDNRHKLAICERQQDCPHRYFVKAHNRQRFCSPECADSIRKQKKDQWWKENRENFIEKWRQQRNKARKSQTRKSGKKRG